MADEQVKFVGVETEVVELVRKLLDAKWIEVEVACDHLQQLGHDIKDISLESNIRGLGSSDDNATLKVKNRPVFRVHTIFESVGESACYYVTPVWLDPNLDPAKQTR